MTFRAQVCHSQAVARGFPPQVKPWMVRTKLGMVRTIGPQLTARCGPIFVGVFVGFRGGFQARRKTPCFLAEFSAHRGTKTGTKPGQNRDMCPLVGD
jgi:hypothetical protein